jgi:hypothetical protein
VWVNADWGQPKKRFLINQNSDFGADHSLFPGDD